MDSLDVVRNEIYASIVRTGEVPSAAELGARLDRTGTQIAAALHALADAHVIVLAAGATEIVWVPPFSAVPTPFPVTSGSMAWHAPCAWDAFGIPAALKRDAVVDARCAWSGEPVPCGVAGGRAYGDGVIHLLVPAAHFWDDIGYT